MFTCTKALLNGNIMSLYQDSDSEVFWLLWLCLTSLSSLLCFSSSEAPSCRSSWARWRFWFCSVSLWFSLLLSERASRVLSRRSCKTNSVQRGCRFHPHTVLPSRWPWISHLSILSLLQFLTCCGELQAGVWAFSLSLNYNDLTVFKQIKRFIQSMSCFLFAQYL